MKIGYLMQQGVDIKNPPYNGPANHVREVVKGLQHLGHTVRVLVCLEGETWKTDDLEFYEPVHVHWLNQGILRIVERGIRRIQSELKLPYVAFFESLRFASACKQTFNGFDILFERFSWMGYGGAIAAKWMDIPLILEDNGDHLADLDAKGIAPEGIQRSLSLKTTRWAANHASHTVSTGEGWRRQFIKRWQVDAEKVSVIENGTIVPTLLDRGNLRSFQKLSASLQIPTLVYLGGFYPWHGVEILLQAFTRALESKYPMSLILIGSGMGEKEAHQLVKDLEISDSINFTGHLSPIEFAPILANSDIGLSPYCNWMEYSGLKIFDYKAAGLAVIASGENGMPSTLTEGKTGLIIPPCNEDALTTAILKLVNNLDWAWKMGREGRREAETKHQWKHTVGNLEKTFSIHNNK